MIQDCQNRPIGVTVSEWCQEHSITTSNYYYRMAQVRNPYNDSSHLRDGEYIILRRIMYAVGLQGHHYQTLRAINVR